MSSFKYFCISMLFLSAFLSGGLCQADSGAAQDTRRIKREANLTLGYQSFSLTDSGHRAAEYSSLKSSPAFGLNFYNESQDADHLHLQAEVLSDEDYNAEVDFNMNSRLRLELQTERFIHNLDHIPYDNGSIGDGNSRLLTDTPAIASRPDGIFNSDIRTYYTDHNPNDVYRLQVDLSEVALRAKLPAYPAHLNLAYWRLEKKGSRQLRFLDENCTGCHMQSRTRNIDRVTEEVKAGVDAHLGYVDVSLEGLHREFRDQEDIPQDLFGSHFRGRGAAVYEHSEDPDSEVNELTLRANTSPSGGFAGSASFTVGERENNSGLTSVGPVRATTDYYKSTADATYTPSKFWTFNLRYRLFDIDNNNSDIITAYAGGDPSLEVRTAPDFNRAWYEAIINYRPSSRFTIKSELRREDIERSHTGPATAHHSGATDVHIAPYWELPEQETVTSAKLGFYARLLEKSALKFSGWAMLKENDDPAYGTSFAESKELFFSANYAPSAFWGLAASLDILDEQNHERTANQLFDHDSDALTADLEIPYDLDREREQQSLSLGAWFVPANGLSFDVNYGHLRTTIKQDLLFGAEVNPLNPLANYTIEANDADYRQRVQTLSAGASWQIVDSISCRLEGSLIRSKADFSPEFAPLAGYLNGATASSNELREISKVDIRQHGLKGRINWQLDEAWACSLEAAFNDYDDINNDVFDGSVASYMASLSRRW